MRCSGEHQQPLELHSRADLCTWVYCKENGLKPASDDAGRRPVPHSPHTASPGPPSAAQTHLHCDLQQRLFISAERNFLVAKSLPGGGGKIPLFISQALARSARKKSLLNASHSSQAAPSTVSLEAFNL